MATPIRRARNGVFNTVLGGKVLNRQVSAVGLYDERFTEWTFEQQLRIYHNLYSFKPLAEEIFHGIPQVVPWETNDGIQMRWLNSAPHED